MEGNTYENKRDTHRKNARPSVSTATATPLLLLTLTTPVRPLLLPQPWLLLLLPLLPCLSYSFDRKTTAANSHRYDRRPTLGGAWGCKACGASPSLCSCSAARSKLYAADRCRTAWAVGFANVPAPLPARVPAWDAPGHARLVRVCCQNPVSSGLAPSASFTVQYVLQRAFNSPSKDPECKK